MARKLRYIGKGEFFPGIPAGNFTCPSDKEAECLVASGLYEYAGKPGQHKLDEPSIEEAVSGEET